MSRSNVTEDRGLCLPAVRDAFSSSVSCVKIWSISSSCYCCLIVYCDTATLSWMFLVVEILMMLRYKSWQRESNGTRTSIMLLKLTSDSKIQILTAGNAYKLNFVVACLVLFCVFVLFRCSVSWVLTCIASANGCDGSLIYIIGSRFHLWTSDKRFWELDCRTSEYQGKQAVWNLEHYHTGVSTPLQLLEGISGCEVHVWS